MTPSQVAFQEDLAKKAALFFTDPPCTIINSRVPYTLDNNTYTQYGPSDDCLGLVSEQGRTIHPEDIQWKSTHPPMLTDCCVQVLSKYFKELLLLEELPCDNRDYFLELLPTNLPLEIVIPKINYDHYWKRKYADEFGKVLYHRRPDWTWKSLYVERYMQKVLEDAQPQYEDEREMDDLVILCEPYVQTLRVSQLQAWMPPLTMDKEDIPEVYPEDHIDFKPVFKNLQNLEEFDLIYGMNNVGEKFEWHMFRLSIADCARLGTAITELKQLKILRLHRSKIEDLHCQALMRGLVLNETLEELDLSHCHISDQGALCIAKLIMVHPKLEALILCNNLIKGTGGEGIGYALMQEDSCPLKLLDMRLNPLGHDGALGLMRSLVRTEKPEKLNLASCEFEEMTAFVVGFMLKVNKSLVWLDISNNWFGQSGGDSLIMGLEENENLKWLDVRETFITDEQLKRVRMLMRRNNNEDMEEDMGSEIEQAIIDMESEESEEEGDEEEEEEEEGVVVEVTPTPAATEPEVNE